MILSLISVRLDKKRIIEITIIFLTMMLLCQIISSGVVIGSTATKNDQNNNYSQGIRYDFDIKAISSEKIGEFDNDIGDPEKSFIDDDLAYIVGYGTGLMIYDVSTESDPTLISEFREGESFYDRYLTDRLF